jgi:hypothetical protein
LIFPDRVIFVIRHVQIASGMSTAIPLRKVNRAALPVPSTLPELPAKPAKVVTTPQA